VSRSGPATAGSASMALAAIAAINTVLDFKLKTLLITVASMSCDPDATSARPHPETASCGPPERRWKNAPWA
jgi:hypothetical protein